MLSRTLCKFLNILRKAIKYLHMFCTVLNKYVKCTFPQKLSELAETALKTYFLSKLCITHFVCLGTASLLLSFTQYKSAGRCKSPSGSVSEYHCRGILHTLLPYCQLNGRTPKFRGSRSQHTHTH